MSSSESLRLKLCLTVIFFFFLATNRGRYWHFCNIVVKLTALELDHQDLHLCSTFYHMRFGANYLTSLNLTFPINEMELIIPTV